MKELTRSEGRSIDSECDICRELQNPKAGWFFREVGSRLGVTSRVLFRSDHWCAIPTAGCLTVGYLLLVCTEHEKSIANLQDSLFFELLEFKSRVEAELLARTGKRCICFEHGTTTDTVSGANSIEHVHLHLVPFDAPVWNRLASSFSKEFVLLRDYMGFRAELKKRFPLAYLLFQDTDGSLYYIPDAVGLPSQLFRRLLAPLLGAKKWNWREEPYARNMLRTIRLFNQNIGENK